MRTQTPCQRQVQTKSLVSTSDQLCCIHIFLRTGKLHNCYQGGTFSAEDTDNSLLILALLKIVRWCPKVLLQQETHRVINQFAIHLMLASSYRIAAWDNKVQVSNRFAQQLTYNASCHRLHSLGCPLQATMYLIKLIACNSNKCPAIYWLHCLWLGKSRLIYKFTCAVCTSNIVSSACNEVPMHLQMTSCKRFLFVFGLVVTFCTRADKNDQDKQNCQGAADSAGIQKQELEGGNE